MTDTVQSELPRLFCPFPRTIMAPKGHGRGTRRGASIFPIQPAPPVTPLRPVQQGKSKTVSLPSPEEFPDPSETDGDSDPDDDDIFTAKTVPIITSPIKKRQNAPVINRQSDIKVWGMADRDILGKPFNMILKNKNSDLYEDAALSSWRSPVYDHYTVTLRRKYDTDGDPESLSYVFTCKTHPEHHITTRSRLRAKTGDGTTNLQKDVDACLLKQGIVHEKPGSSAILYSAAAHRALIALRCAKSGRPINFVTDEDYIREVQMLRPGTIPPHPSTVQRDLLEIYEQTSIAVKSYFAV